MKIFLLILLLFPVIALGQEADSVLKLQTGIDRIMIVKVNFSFDVVVNVDCDEFYSQFGGICDTIIINSQRDIKSIKSYLDNSKKSDLYVDARGKMYIYYISGRTDVLCINSGESYRLNDESMLFPDTKLMEWVDSLKQDHERHWGN